MSEERGCRTIVKIDATDRELVDAKAPELPTIELFTRKTSEVADFNGADPASAGKLRIRSSLKHPSPGVLAHSVDALIEVRGAVTIMSETSVRDDFSVIDTPGRRAGRGGLPTVPSRISKVIDESDFRFPGTDRETGLNVVSFPYGPGPAAASALHARTPPVHPSPGAANRSMDEEGMCEDHFAGAKTKTTPLGKGTGRRHQSASRAVSREVLIPTGVGCAFLEGAPTPAEGVVGFGDWRKVANACHPSGKSFLERSASDLLDAPGMNGCDFLTDAGNSDREGEVEASALTNNGIGLLKADKSSKNVRPEAQGGSSSGRMPSDYARTTGGRPGSLAEHAPRKEANVRNTTEHEFGPIAAQYLDPLTIIGRTGKRLSGFGSDDADDNYELKTTRPLGDVDAGSDQVLDE